MPKGSPKSCTASTAATMATEAGSDLRNTFARKPPVTRSRFGSIESANEGQPITALDRSVIWMGMNG